MTSVDRWLLPDGIDEVLPPDARRIETLRRQLLDLLDHWGYDFVIPPALEYLDSLLTGAGQALNLQTFKVTDQLSGRLMGLSADTTPQVARIDAHSLAPEGVSRLSYCRTVFHAQASSLLASRTPNQIGAELYGGAGHNADVEIISLMLATLEQANIADIHLDMGHVGVFRTLAAKEGLNKEQKTALFKLLTLKCHSDLDAWVETEISDTTIANAFKTLLRLQGDRTALDAAVMELVEQVPELATELTRLQQVADQVQARYPAIPIYFDLTELRGYDYHTGLVFAAYVPGYGDEIARGGRYDESGAAFGRARPAIGFSADLKVLAQFSRLENIQPQTVYAPNSDDSELWQKIQQLRKQGVRVVQLTDLLANDERPEGASLQYIDDQWQLVDA